VLILTGIFGFGKIGATVFLAPDTAALAAAFAAPILANPASAPRKNIFSSGLCHYTIEWQGVNTNFAFI